MKKLFATLVFMFTLGVFYCFAQDDTLRNSQQAMPQGQQGTQKVPEEGITEQKEDRVEVDKRQLPPAMQKALQDNEQYTGWEESTIYYERNTDQYLLHIIKENSTQTFRFDKDGKPITTDQPIESQESKQ